MRSHSLFIASLACALATVFAGASCDSKNPSGEDAGDMDVVTPPGDGGGMDGSTMTDGSTDDAEAGGDPDCTVPKCAVQITLGLEHACALAKDGTVFCWGLNSLGQLGVGAGGMTDSGAFDTRNSPQQVMGLGPAKSITAGYYHTCAHLNDDSVWCWGDNSKGQLASPADGGAQPPKPMPVKINGAPSMITQLQAGGFHTCALAGGSLSCWGLNSSGQIGTGSLQPEAGIAPAIIASPMAVANVSGGTDLGLGDQFTCVATASDVRCFGSNFFGQLGRGGDAGTPAVDPTPAAAMGLGMGADLSKSGGSHQCAIASSNGSCWGRNQWGQANPSTSTHQTTPAAVMGLMMPQEIAPGSTHTCALLSNGNVQCWGRTNNGQAGQPGGDPEAGVPMPTNVQGLTNVIRVASGWGDFSCAIIKGGAVWCWGANYQGQLGRGGNAPPYDNVPKKITFP